ncbi:hypothetical protein G6F44_002929 [Rhizopus delemar]|nr:hypothetical protein G6F44_002929 [Rhizopus delemar]
MKKKDKRNSTKSPTNLITEESHKCFEKVDDLTVDTYLLEKPNKVTFSGTDNGLVTLSETVGFDMKKLRFHLDLYKWYRAPGTENSYDTSTLDKYLLSVPTSFKVKSKDLLYLSGGYTYRNNLLRAKRSSLSGASATKSEALLNEKHMIVFAPLREEAALLVLLKRVPRGSLCLSATEAMATAPDKKGAIALKTVNGASVCNNNECILSLSDTSHKARDSVSALAIGISGASRLTSGTTLEVFNPSATTTIR